MNILIAAERSATQLVQQIDQALTGQGHAVTTLVRPLLKAAADPTRGEEAKRGLDYDALWTWEPDRDWLQTLIRRSRRPGGEAKLVEQRLAPLAQGLSSLARQQFGGIDLLVVIDDWAILPVVAPGLPYVAVFRRPPNGAQPGVFERLAKLALPLPPIRRRKAMATCVQPLLRMAVRDAPAVLCVAGAEAGVRGLEPDSDALEVCQRDDQFAKALPRAADRAMNPEVQRRSGMASLQQNRAELRYEAASVGQYDQMYHGCASFRWMDQELVRIMAHHLPDRTDSRRLLDLGCGPGSLAPELRRVERLEVIGLDLSPEMIAEARKRHPDMQWKVGDIESLPFPDDSFDAVLISGVLHHLPVLDRALSEVRRVLRSDGVLVAREPNLDNFAARHPEAAFAHLCLKHYLATAHGFVRPADPGAHGYHRDFTPSLLAEEVQKWLRVEHVAAPLRVSYFYDMFPEQEAVPELEQLEQTLDNQPGLHLVVVGRMSGERGVAPAAQADLDRLARPAALRPEHFDVLCRFAQRVTDGIYLVDEHRPPTLDGEGLPAAVERRLRAADAVLVVGDLGEPVHRVLAPQPRTGQVLEFESEISDRDATTQYDLVLARLPLPVGAAAIHRLVDRCAAYGCVYLELTAAEQQDSDPLETDFSRWPGGIVAHWRSSEGDRTRLLMRRWLFGRLDIWRATRIAVERQASHGDADRAPWQPLLDRLDPKIEQLATTYSYFGLGGRAAPDDVQTKGELVQRAHAITGAC